MHSIPTQSVELEVFADEQILNTLKQDGSLEQAKNMAQLPGTCKACVMPDAHLGYGFPIGGVLASDVKQGIISPGGVGFDINCGMRLLKTTLTKDQITQHINALNEAIYKKVPVGMGRDSDIKLTHEQLDQVLIKGAQWTLEQGMATQADVDHMEDQGQLPADPSKVSPTAKKRGKNQLGTLGGGNHFIEIQAVEDILDESTAQAFGLFQDQVLIMIHCGSRGIGHQVCTDYIREIKKHYPDQNIPDENLAYAPLQSQLGQDYFSAMCAAMNFAWANRQVITHKIRETFKEVMGEQEITLLYDMSHNNAKIEKHLINNEPTEVCVHRKGAARAFAPGHKDIPLDFQKTGQPVLIPGSMGTSSYILSGTQQAMEKSLGTTCHGAGRTMSRKKANESISLNQVEQQLQARGVKLKAHAPSGVVNEAPDVYKDIDQVISVCAQEGIAKPVVKLQPLGVIKG